MTNLMTDLRALVDIHREPWSVEGWGRYPASTLARRISDALDAGHIVVHEPEDAA